MDTSLTFVYFELLLTVLSWPLSRHFFEKRRILDEFLPVVSGRVLNDDHQLGALVSLDSIRHLQLWTKCPLLYGFK